MLDKLTAIEPCPWWKRSCDLIGAAVGLIMFSPLMIGIAAYIKLVSPGPVLFKHLRVGLHGEPMFVWKFRSMQLNTDPAQHQAHVLELTRGEAPLTKMSAPNQLIPLGHWLRCTALDELPQLIQVLRGDMSLVGPRPDVIPVDQFEQPHQTRFHVLPGLTGLWQVSGKNRLTFQEMAELDAQYANRRSPWLDMKIILLTVPAIVHQIADDLSPDDDYHD